jgi:hypothetical protein
VLADRFELWRNYVLTILPAPRGFDVFFPERINNRGQVLGEADASRGEFADESHAALYSEGRTRDLHLLVPGAETNRNSLAVGLSDEGHVLFRAFGGGPCDQYFLYHEGSVQEFSKLTGRPDLTPLDINVSGHTVGLAGDPCERDEPTEAFLYTDGVVSLLGKLDPYPNSGARDISNSGFILGWVWGENESRTVIFTPDGIADLGSIGGFAINDAGFVLSKDGVWFGGSKVFTVPFDATGFNNRNQVVGVRATGWPPQGFLYSNGQTHDLKSLFPHWQWIAASGINDRGQIVGYGRHANGKWHGVLLTPRR